MKQKAGFILSVILLVSYSYCLAGQKYRIILKNSLQIVRVDEPIVIVRDSLEKNFGKFNDTLAILIKDRNGNLVPSQQDDIDDDRRWDELALVLNFNPDETKSIFLELVPKKQMPVFQKRAHVHLGVSRQKNDIFTEVKEEERPRDHVAQSVPFLYQFEGPGWENDKIAFRTYFDSRNGKDVFGKLIPDMVLDSVGLPGKSYHDLAPWGMDVLKVGKSLGAGAIAVTDGDSLFRLGDTEKAHYKVIADGPVRAIFELQYSGWKVKDSYLGLKEQISIWAGKYCFSSKAFLTKNTENNLNLVSGIVLPDNVSPETAQTDSFVIITVNDIVSENKDFLSLGIMTRSSDYKFRKVAPVSGKNDEIVKTAYFAFKNNTPIEYFIFSGWEKSDLRFKNEKYLNAIMKEEALKFTNRIFITY